MSEVRSLGILYEDMSCIVAEKPQGIPSEDGSGETLPSLLRALRKERGEPQEIYPVHRLDKPTGGAILYAKTKDSAAFYSSAVAHRELGKRYLAVLSGTPEASFGELSDYLYHDKRTNKVFVVKGERKGAKSARLEYRTVETVMHEGMPLTLAEINLKTGRTHQIRVQFASRKLPLYGDRRYGAGTSLPGGRIALWSHCLIFTGQGMSEAKSVTSLPPCEFPWNLFPAIDALRKDKDRADLQNV